MIFTYINIYIFGKSYIFTYLSGKKIVNLGVKVVYVHFYKQNKITSAKMLNIYMFRNKKSKCDAKVAYFHKQTKSEEKVAYFIILE